MAAGSDIFCCVQQKEPLLYMMNREESKYNMTFHLSVTDKM